MDDLIESTLNHMRSGLVGKLISVLESVLNKLGRYDEGSVIGSILSIAVRRLTESEIQIPEDPLYCLLICDFHLEQTQCDWKRVRSREAIHELCPGQHGSNCQKDHG